MFQTHPFFTLGLSDNAAVWRYTSLSKFVSLLQTRTLYFAQVGSLADPFEGMLSLANRSIRYSDSHALVDGNEFGKIRTGLQTGTRSSMYVNCWHANEFESAAMWRLYSLEGEGIAIKSTIGALRASFTGAPEPVYIGEVKYMDYLNEESPMQNAFQLVLRKQRSFEHEREVRCVSLHIEGVGDIKKLDPDLQPIGLHVPVDVETLVQQVYVAPNLEPWLLDVVGAVCTKFDLSREPNEGMADRPLI
jgi:hypothetical protein